MSIRRHLTTKAFLVVVARSRGATSIYRVEARNVANPPTMPRAVSYTVELSSPKCEYAEVKAEVRKPWPIKIDPCPIFKVLLGDYILFHCLKALATRNF